MTRIWRVGLIVPSSNLTMETEIPAMLARRQAVEADAAFTFHSSRMRMQRVTPEELARMDADSDRCALELSDARCDVLAYACLIAIMAQGAGYHTAAAQRLSAVSAGNGAPVPVVTSAGALLEGIEALGVQRVALIAPYLKPLTGMVVDYLQASGVQVVDSLSLECPDNLQVARLDPAGLVDAVRRLDLAGAQAVVLSACVQMPSLPVIQRVEDSIGLPVLSAATATTFALLRRLGLSPVVPDAGRLLSGSLHPQQQPL